MNWLWLLGVSLKRGVYINILIYSYNSRHWPFLTFCFLTFSSFRQNLLTWKFSGLINILRISFIVWILNELGTIVSCLKIFLSFEFFEELVDRNRLFIEGLFMTVMNFIFLHPACVVVFILFHELLKLAKVLNISVIFVVSIKLRDKAVY